MASYGRFTRDKVRATLLLLLGGSKFLLVEYMHGLINFFVGEETDSFSRVLLSHIWGLKVVLVKKLPESKELHTIRFLLK
jgi:hypothetical protein